MKPVDQTLFHDPDAGVVGDCFRACVASILELSIDEVPHFFEDGGRVWWFELDRFLAQRGLAAVEFTTSSENVLSEAAVYIASGPSPRHPEVHHAIVCRGFDVVHDPHPSRDGIESTERQLFFVTREEVPLGS